MGTCLKKGVDAVLAIKEYTVPDFLAELKIFLPLAGLVNVAEELTRVGKNMEKIQKEMGGLSDGLNNALL